MISNFLLALIFFVAILFAPGLGQAEDFSSTNFILRNPVFDDGSFGTSTNFQYVSVTNELGIDVNSGSISFGYENDPLTFPIPRQPVVTATAVAGGVSLSWVDTTGFAGSITAFDVGVSTVSGGPYTFSSFSGSTTSSTISSLTAGTTYYFIVRAKAGSLVLSESVQMSAVPLVGSTPSSGGGSSGGSAFDINSLWRLPLPGPRRPVAPLAFNTIDFNRDGRIDVADLSILLYYFDRTGSEIVPYDLNSDGIIDLVDVSILLYYWTDNNSIL